MNNKPSFKIQVTKDELADLFAGVTFVVGNVKDGPMKDRFFALANKLININNGELE